MESPKDMFVCVILLRPESIARGRLPWMGRREIFLTNLACVVPKHMIRDKVMVTSLQNLTEVKQKRKGKQLYYARVSYDVDKKEFFDYSSIDFLCLCVQPKNPIVLS